MEITLNGYYTLILATLVLLFGRFLVNRIKFFEEFHIPESVVGGMVAAIIVYLLNLFFGYSFTIYKKLQVACMLMFFTSVGLSADFARLKAGGMPLLVFTIVASVFIIVQNVVGVSVASALGLEPLIGLVTGSIALVGGYGTAGAWGATLEEQYQLVGATTLGIAAATYGLVSGGLVGGPVARRLITKKLGISPSTHEDKANDTASHAVENTDAHEQVFEKSDVVRLITANSTIETLAMFAGALAFASIMTDVAKGTWFEVPTFMWALLGGIIIRNVLTIVFKFDMFDRAIDVFGNAALNLFLAMALLNLKLWELADLAGPLFIILACQTIAMIGYAYFVCFRVMGKDYDAAVLSAGLVGFGLGATPTAIANMQAITDRYMPSQGVFDCTDGGCVLCGYC